MLSGVSSAKSEAAQKTAVRTKAQNFIRHLYRAQPETPRIDSDCDFLFLSARRLLVAINRARAAISGGLMIAVLMAAAVFTHLRVKNPPFKMLLSATLLVCSLAAAHLNYRLNFPI